MPNLYPVGGLSVIPAVGTLSTIDLLRQPYVLSQTGLLDEARFRREAKRRGVHIDREELETLHRRGVIVPLYRVTRRATGPGWDLARASQAGGVAWPVYNAAAAGRLQDPGATPFRPWPSRWDDTAVYYSRFQLLIIRALPHVFTKMRYRRVGEGIDCELDPLDPRNVASFAADRALAIALEVLAPRYLPRILHTYKSPADDYIDFVHNRDPMNERAFLDLDPGVVLRQAESLLSSARFFDPLGKWHRVTRIANRARWDDLSFDALLAQEYRLAAETLLLYLEDEVTQGRANPLPNVSETFREPRHDRLTITQRERAETIMDFRLSDRPAVFLALEGQTEINTARRVLTLWGHEEFSPLISLVDLDGVKGDVKLLARSVAVPRLDPNGYRGARVLAPLSALVVAADPEDRYRTAADRKRLEQNMKDAVLRSLPPALRTAAMRDDLDHLLFVRTWPHEFEFAHFTDTELARAIRAVTPGAPRLSDLRNALVACRRRGGPFKSVWANWTHSPSKVAIAEAAWPALERRLLRRGRRPVPIAGLLAETFRIATNVRRAREIAV